MSIVDTVHGGYVHRRRVRVLVELLATMIPAGSHQILDVGCGDGMLMALLNQLRPELSIQGIDVLVRKDTRIPVAEFDGHTIPLPDKSVDIVTFIDVLHHTTDPGILLRQAARVARNAVVLKDHLRQGFLAESTLRFMDWVGNSRHGVALPFNYQSPAEWERCFRSARLEMEEQMTALGIYPAWADWLFGRRLHVLARLKPLPGTSHRLHEPLLA